MIYLQLLLAFLQIGLFSIGGGYAAIPLIESQTVDQFGWLSADEFTNLISIAEMTPGPIAVNAATFVGIRIAGIPGAMIATLGCILPSCIIVLTLATLYYRYKKMNTMQTILATLRPVVVASIASAGISMLLLAVFSGDCIAWQQTDLPGLILFVSAFFAIRKLKWSPILTMGLCGVLYLAINLIM